MISYKDFEHIKSLDELPEGLKLLNLVDTDEKRRVIYGAVGLQYQSSVKLKHFMWFDHRTNGKAYIKAFEGIYLFYGFGASQI